MNRKNFGRFLRSEDGMGTVEIILIIVVLRTVYKECET